MSVSHESTMYESTMFAALYGELTAHPWRDPQAASSDAYSLFVARSSAMGWLATAAEAAPGGLWGMNDAGQDLTGPRAAWFQVSLAEPLVPAGHPLPVQPFLACAGDVTARIGALHLRAVQLLLPVQALDTGGEPPATAALTLLEDAGWFADRDPHRGSRVRVTLDGGQNPAVRSAAPALVQWTRELDQNVFSCDVSSLTHGEGALDDFVRRPPVIDELWNGPAEHRATFDGTLAEWSLDALGWLAAFLAEAGHRHGIDTPLMLTVTR
ncbi:MAG TPA: hypothetical protein VF069_15295 [Streptosporangiaceae bacterium]